MARRTNFKGEKRAREIARQKKQEEKRLKKAERKAAEALGLPGGAAPVEGEATEVPPEETGDENPSEE